jgi:glycolate oxidase iron-sulfur subunit
MTRIKALARLVRGLEERLSVCMRCGMCQAVCPVFGASGREADVARGKLALLDGLMQELLKDPEAVWRRLDRCLLCGACAAHCPSGVQGLEIFLKARAILTGYLGLPPLKRAVLRSLLSRPALFDRLLKWGARLQGIFVRPVDDLLGSSCARIASPLLGGRHFKALAPAPFHARRPASGRQPGPGRPRVAVFVGCLLDKLFPQVPQAMLEVLAHHGVGWQIPSEQGCCGIPALSAGDLPTFTALVRHNLARFQAASFDYLVTACATCTATIKTLWPLMAQELAAPEQARVAEIAAKALDISQFLVEQVGISPPPAGPGENAITVTYHDPCHLKKSLGVAAQPRALLKAPGGCRFIEMPESDRCCGGGGSFALQHYDLAAAIGQRKLMNLRASGAAVVATACPACMVHLIDMLSQAGVKMQVKHVVEIYAQGLKAVQGSI